MIEKIHTVLPRITASSFLIASVFIFPWWLTLCGAFLFSGVLKNYWEVVGIGLLFDGVYGSATPLAFIGTLSTVTVYLVVWYIRNSLLR
jgi:hypothetical protein